MKKRITAAAERARRINALKKLRDQALALHGALDAEIKSEMDADQDALLHPHRQFTVDDKDWNSAYIKPFLSKCNPGGVVLIPYPPGASGSSEAREHFGRNVAVVIRNTWGKGVGNRHQGKFGIEVTRSK